MLDATALPPPLPPGCSALATLPSPLPAQAEMSSDSYQLQGMSERGFLPSVFNRRRWGGRRCSEGKRNALYKCAA